MLTFENDDDAVAFLISSLVHSKYWPIRYHEKTTQFQMQSIRSELRRFLMQSIDGFRYGSTLYDYDGFSYPQLREICMAPRPGAWYMIAITGKDCYDYRENWQK